MVKYLAAKYPQISVLNGVEHWISVLFSDVENIPAIKTLTNKTKQVNQVFG